MEDQINIFDQVNYGTISYHGTILCHGTKFQQQYKAHIQRAGYIVWLFHLLLQGNFEPYFLFLVDLNQVVSVNQLIISDQRVLNIKFILNIINY